MLRSQSSQGHIVFNITANFDVFVRPSYLVLSKCKRMNFHSFKELNEGQHVFEGKTTLKGVKVVILITIFHSFWNEKFTLTHI